MKIKKDYAIIMCTNGTFIRLILRKNMEVGQKIYFFQEDIYLKKSNVMKFNKKVKNYFAIIATILLFFIGQFAINNYLINTYLGIDINPSIELSLNKYNKVIKIEGLNNDGIKVVKNSNIKGLSIDNAIIKIIKTSKELDYIDENNNNILITIETNGKDKKEIEEKLIKVGGIEKDIKENNFDEKLDKDTKDKKSDFEANTYKEDFDKNLNENLEDILIDKGNYKSILIEEKSNLEKKEQKKILIEEIEKNIVVDENIASTSPSTLKISKEDMDKILKEGYFDSNGDYVKYEKDKLNILNKKENESEEEN